MRFSSFRLNRSDLPLSPVTRALLELLVLTAGAFAIPLLVYMDAVVLSDHVSEQSLTENTQSLFIGLTAVAFALGAGRLPAAKGYLLALTTLASVMFIREADGLLDGITDGFWAYPALICILVGGFMTWRYRATIRPGFLAHFPTRHGTMMLFGFIFLIVFSRAFGSGDLWRGVLGDTYTWQLKTVVQEGLELVGYALVAYAVVGSSLTNFGVRSDTK